MEGAAPEFSVVVPVYGRGPELAACVESLAALEAPAGGFEVVVVDDGSPEPLDAFVAPFRGRMDVTLLRQANAGPAAARNAGAAAARGRWLAFTDSDCRPARDWLERLGAVLGARPECAVGGRVVNVLDSVFSAASQWQMDYLYRYYNAEAGRAEFLATNNLALARARFLEAGGFDASFRLPAGEDREFSMRWRRAGREMVYAAEAVVFHAHRLSLGGFWAQHYRYGRGACALWRMERAQGRRFPPPRPGFYRGLLGSAPSAALVCLQAVSQVAALCGFARERFRRAEE